VAPILKRLAVVCVAVFAGVGGLADVAAAAGSITAAPTSFGSGQTVTVTGTGFAAGETVNVWFDGDGDVLQGSSEPSAVAVADSSGAFGASLVVKGSPGGYFVRAGTPAAVALSAVTIGTCWFQECFIDDQQFICILGNSPSDGISVTVLGVTAFLPISDCKALDSSYSDASDGYNLANSGPRFAGAGVLAAAVNDLGLLVPGSGCVAMTNAIAAAKLLGNGVPGEFDFADPTKGLHNIACGAPFGPDPITIGFDLPLYIAAETLAGHGADPALLDATVILGVVAAVNAAAAAAEAAALLIPGTPPGVTFVSVLAAAQQVVAAAAVSGAIACGHVNYFCDGLDITFNIMLKNTLQTKLVPLPVPGLAGKRWGDIIGWAMPVCHSNTMPAKKPDGSYEKGECEQKGNEAMVAMPGSAGPNNTDASIECATGKVVGMSIGYDGDISFDVNDGATYDFGAIDPVTHLPYPPGTLIDPTQPGPMVAGFTNYHNFQPGPGGSDAPGGIDVEIPRFDMARFLPQILAMRKGKTVKVCGSWVADMHQLWNEFHPVTRIDILVDTTPPVITPTITGTLGTNGWYVGNVAVDWSEADAESAISSSSGCGPTTIATDTDAVGQELVCLASSEGGATTRSVTIKRDATAPAIGHGVSPSSPDGSVDWYATAPTVTFSCSDASSGISSCGADGQSGASVTLGENTLAQTVTGTAIDNAGNVSHDSASLRVDLSNPTISAATDRPANANGWFNAAVVVSFTCADAISGVKTCTGPISLVGQGATQSASGTVTDAAGRMASTTISGLNIDTTPPVVTYSGNASPYTVDQTVHITCAASDALSGVATNTCSDTIGPAWNFFGVGLITLSASATDRAGNTGTASTTFSVTVTEASLDILLRQFFGSDQTGSNGLIAKVHDIVTAPNANAKRGDLRQFNDQVDAKTGNPLTAAQAALLKQLAAAL
jgi:hypothetical protein